MKENSLSKRLLDNMEYARQASIEMSIPHNMLLEVTNICNDKCIFCANSKSTREKKYIDGIFARRILKEAFNEGVREVGFHATGEPLANPSLEEYISLSKEIGYEYTYLTTNGSLLDEKRANSLIEAGIDSVKFSINACSNVDYKFIHGKDDYDIVINNLRRFNELRKIKSGNRIRLYVSCILTRQTSNIREKVIDTFDELCDEIIIEECFNQGGYMHELTDTVAVDGKVRFENKYSTCYFPFNCIHISVEGYLTMCCMDFQNYLAVEDLNKMSLREAWNSDRAKIFRKKMIEQSLDDTLCFNCINNTERNIYPLNDALANSFDYSCWKNKKNEINNRINDYAESKHI